MAQYWYDLSIAAPRQWPYVLKGSNPAVQSNVVFSAGGVITSDGDRVSLYSVSSVNAWRLSLTEETFGDFEMVLKSRRSRENTTHYINTGNGVVFRRGSDLSGDHGYYIGTGSVRTNFNRGTLYVWGTPPSTTGSQSQLAAPAAGLYPATSSEEIYATPTYLRVRLLAGVVYVRGWKEGDVEPESWYIEHTLPTPVWPAANVGILTHGYSSQTEYYWMSVGTDGDPAPMEQTYPNRNIQGIVRNLDNTAAGPGITVRCFHRATGCFLDETITGINGEYTMDVSVPPNDDITLTAYDTVGNVRNDKAVTIYGPQY